MKKQKLAFGIAAFTLLVMHTARIDLSEKVEVLNSLQVVLPNDQKVVDKTVTKKLETHKVNAIENTFDVQNRFTKAAENLKNMRKPASDENQARLTPVLSEHRLLQGTPWKVWLKKRVVPKGEQPEENSTSDTVSNLNIIEDPSEEIVEFTKFDLNKPVAVFNERLKKPGVITGTIKIEIESGSKSDLQADLDLLSAKINGAFEPIETYFITSTEPVFNLERLYELLKKRSYVKNLELEILNKTYEHK